MIARRWEAMATTSPPITSTPSRIHSRPVTRRSVIVTAQMPVQHSST